MLSERSLKRKGPKMADRLFWQIYSHFYDSIQGLIPYQILLEMVKDEIYLSLPLKVLDAGCGTGNLELAINQGPNRIQITAIDFAKEMICRARKKNKDLKNLDFQMVNLDGRLPFPNESFDVAVLINVLYCLKNPDAVIKELKRVLKKDGRVIVATPKQGLKLTRIFAEHIEKTTRNLENNRQRLLSWLSIVTLFLSLLIIGLLNLLILRKAKRKNYYFFGQEELENLFTVNGFETEKIANCYGNQDWFGVFLKNP